MYLWILNTWNISWDQVCRRSMPLLLYDLEVEHDLLAQLLEGTSLSLSLFLLFVRSVGSSSFARPWIQHYTHIAIRHLTTAISSSNRVS